MINMKKKILLTLGIIVMTFYTINSNAQEKLDVQSHAYYSSIVSNTRSNIINKDFSNFFQIMKEHGVDFKSFLVTYTSPWTKDSKGKAYIKEIIFCIVNFFSLEYETNYDCFVVTPEEKILFDDFVNKCPQTSPYSILKDFKHVKIKSFNHKVDQKVFTIE